MNQNISEAFISRPFVLMEAFSSDTVYNDHLRPGIRETATAFHLHDRNISKLAWCLFQCQFASWRRSERETTCFRVNDKGIFSGTYPRHLGEGVRSVPYAIRLTPHLFSDVRGRERLLQKPWNGSLLVLTYLTQFRQY